ncbi:metal-sensitive transcriptional regulator [Paracoccus zhejiangensis]|uniref:Transcriptional regulator n=1 Tax=Paracoccus zhejiangensis TaxID=1077935 RepID=A0A2H5F1A4_9RHOB|nr:metal-sensitive transcriptional regulator [Paracoccus zhejiangensis]AUH65312.1 transcriptional regulator [Paracoccus zhejiangensis]
MTHDKQNRDAILMRLSRLAGQVQGVSRMVEDGRYCVDVLNQTAAIRSALRAVERLLIEDHARVCMETAIQSGDQDRQRVMFREVVELLEKVRD